MVISCPGSALKHSRLSVEKIYLYIQQGIPAFCTICTFVPFIQSRHEIEMAGHKSYELVKFNITIFIMSFYWMDLLSIWGYGLWYILYVFKIIYMHSYWKIAQILVANTKCCLLYRTVTLTFGYHCVFKPVSSYSTAQRVGWQQNSSVLWVEIHVFGNY